MNLEQAFNNVAHACDECLLSKDQRDSVNQSLQIVVTELNAFDVLKKKQQKEKDKQEKETNSVEEDV